MGRQVRDNMLPCVVRVMPVGDEHTYEA